MELIYKVMPKDYQLIHASDLHIGPLCCFKQGVRDMVNYVKSNEDTYLAFTGDAIDAILPNDRRYNHSSMDKEDWLMTPQDQADRVIELFMPIKDKILFWGLGNHEYKIINSFDIARYICRHLNVPWGGVMCKFIARHPNNRTAHKFLFTHGAGSLSSNAKDPIQRKANMQAALKQKLINTGHTDTIYQGCGHFHRDILCPPNVGDEVLLTDENYEIKQEPRYWADQTADYIPPECRWYACSPGFLKTYAPTGINSISYPETFMYGPTRLGWVLLDIKDSKLYDVKQIDANEFTKQNGGSNGK